MCFCWMHFCNTFEAIIHGGEPLKSEQLVPWSEHLDPWALLTVLMIPRCLSVYFDIYSRMLRFCILEFFLANVRVCMSNLLKNTSHSRSQRLVLVYLNGFCWWTSESLICRWHGFVWFKIMVQVPRLTNSSWRFDETNWRWRWLKWLK